MSLMLIIWYALWSKVHRNPSQTVYTYILYIYYIYIYIIIYILYSRERERSGILDAAQAFGVYWPCEILLTSVVPQSTTKAGIETRLWSAVGAVSRWHFDAFWRQKEWSKTMSRMRVMVVWIFYEFEWCRYDVDVEWCRCCSLLNMILVVQSWCGQGLRTLAEWDESNAMRRWRRREVGMAVDRIRYMMVPKTLW